MNRILSLLLVLGWPLPFMAPSSPRHPDLEKGIGLVQGGEFDAAIPVIEKALATLDTQPRRARERAEAHFYLGIAHLELESPAVARGHFVQAARIDPSFRPDPVEFSRQVLREFEAAREPATTDPSAAGPTPRRRSRLVVVAVAGGAALAGAAVAFGGGGSQGMDTTTTLPTAGASTPTTAPASTVPPTTVETTTTTTAPRPTTTTTTMAPEPTQPPAPTSTTQPAPCQRCQNDSGTPTFQSPADGATVSGTITVRCAPPECKANCPGFDMWYGWCPASAGCHSKPGIASTIGASGTPNYGVSWNTAGASAEITLICVARSGGSPISRYASIEVKKASFQSTGGQLTWVSDLDVPGGQAQVILNGTMVATQGRGRALAAFPPAAESHVEALLLDADGGPGTWRFELGGTFVAGTLRVIAGEVAQVTASTVVFRLQGKPGERVVFAFRTNR